MIIFEWVFLTKLCLNIYDTKSHWIQAGILLIGTLELALAPSAFPSSVFYKYPFNCWKFKIVLTFKFIMRKWAMNYCHDMQRQREEKKEEEKEEWRWERERERQREKMCVCVCVHDRMCGWVSVCVLCILTSFRVLHAPESWLKPFFQENLHFSFSYWSKKLFAWDFSKSLKSESKSMVSGVGGWWRYNKSLYVIRPCLGPRKKFLKETC